MSKKLNDNGLWESSRMMLPEHKEEILNHHDRQKWEQENKRPELDEQELERIGFQLQESIKRDQAAEVTYWNHPKGICKIWGIAKQLKRDTFKIVSDWDLAVIRYNDVINIEFGKAPEGIC
jgi:hypothetical protein